MQEGETVSVAVRPRKVAIHRTEPSDKENVLHGQVVDIAYLGDLSVYKMRLDNGVLIRASVANTRPPRCERCCIGAMRHGCPSRRMPAC